MAEEKTVVMSVGHGEKISGASGIINEVAEAKKVVSGVAAILKENGINVITFIDETSTTQAKNLSTITSFHNSKNRLLDISVHFNASSGGYGSEAFYKDGDSKAQAIASALSKAMADSMGIKNRGAKTKSLAFTSNAKATPVLLEVCFVDSQSDTDKYKANFDKLCNSIAYTIARSVGAESADSVDKWSKGKELPESVKNINTEKVHQPTSATEDSEATANTEGLDSPDVLDTNLQSSLAYTGDPSGDAGGFTVTYVPCDAGTKVIIDKNPISKTYGEPIYPDLIEPRVEPGDYVETIELIQEKLGDNDAVGSIEFALSDMVQMGIDVAKLFFDYDDYIERTAVYDTHDQRYRSKAINFGSPVNHQDPFPVDEKIEELQSHLPYMKIHRLWFCEPHPHTVQLAHVIMDLSDKAEKRMAKVENNLATLYRQVFRLGSRIQINCVYYGGQSEYDKYKTIRCLHHDRVNDGQIMTLDQCLNCTRYEPILGKVYEIENELGQSLDLLKDNNQMSYQNMQSAIQQTKIEHKPSPLAKQFIDLKTIKERKDEDQDFSEIWGESFIMDWTLHPIEKQVPHVRYDDGSETKRLASSHKNIEHHTDPTGAGFQGIGIFYGPYTSAFYDKLGFGGGGSATETGNSFTGTGFYSELEAKQKTKEIIEKNDENFSKITDPEVRKHIDNGRNWANSNTDKGLQNMAKNDYESIVSEVANKHGVDPLLVMAIIIVESGGNPNPETLHVWPDKNGKDSYWGLMQCYYQNLGSSSGDGGASYIAMDTPARIRNNIETGVGMYVGKLKACWNTSNPVLGLSAYNAGQGTIVGNKTTNNRSVADPGLNEKDHENWTFEQILPNLKRNARLIFSEKKASEVANYYPRVHYVYKNLLGKKADPAAAGSGLTGTSDKIKGVNLQFPYSASDIKTKKMYFTSDFGYRDIGSGKEFHYGIDIQSYANAPIIAAAAGKVIHAGVYGGGGTTVILQHENDVRTLYMHFSSIAKGIKVGQTVEAGTVIGYEGSTGRSTGHHLHFQVQIGAGNKGAINPTDIFSFLKGQRSLSTPIKFNL